MPRDTCKKSATCIILGVEDVGHDHSCAGGRSSACRPGSAKPRHCVPSENNDSFDLIATWCCVPVTVSAHASALGRYRGLTTHQPPIRSTGSQCGLNTRTRSGQTKQHGVRYIIRDMPCLISGMQIWELLDWKNPRADSARKRKRICMG